MPASRYYAIQGQQELMRAQDVRALAPCVEKQSALGFPWIGFYAPGQSPTWLRAAGPG